MAAEFMMFDCMCVAPSHKLVLVLLASTPARDAMSLPEGERFQLTHSVAMDGKTMRLSVEPLEVRAEGRSIGPFAAAAILNTTTGMPLGYVAVGHSVTLDEGASFTFKWPSPLLVMQ